MKFIKGYRRFKLYQTSGPDAHVVSKYVAPAIEGVTDDELIDIIHSATVKEAEYDIDRWWEEVDD